MTDHLRSVREAVEKTVSGGGDAPSRLVELLGRGGLVAYGLVHLLVAGLGVRLALGARTVEVDQHGAIAAVAAYGPAGTVVLVACVAGLVAFAAWQVVAAVAGFRWTSGGARTRKRVGAAAKAVSVLAVAAVAVRFVAGAQASSGRVGPQLAAASLIALPAGRRLVAALAAVVLVVAATMIYTGVARTFLGDLVDDVGPRVRRVAAVLGAYGNLARAVVFGTVGVLFAEAAVVGDPRRVGGIDQALRDLVGATRGVAPLLVLSGGLAAFGLYCFVDARYRRA